MDKASVALAVNASNDNHQNVENEKHSRVSYLQDKCGQIYKKMGLNLAKFQKWKNSQKEIKLKQNIWPNFANNVSFRE